MAIIKAAVSIIEKWKKLAIIFMKYESSRPDCLIASKKRPLENESMMAMPPNANPRRLGTIAVASSIHAGG